MRKTLIALMLSATLPVAAMAAPGDGPKPGPRDGGPFKELNLTKEQKRDFRKIMGEHAKQRAEITHRYLEKLPESERNAMRDEFKKSREEQHKALRDMLNPEQQKAFDAHTEKMKERFKDGEFKFGPHEGKRAERN